MERLWAKDDRSSAPCRRAAHYAFAAITVLALIAPAGGATLATSRPTALDPVIVTVVVLFMATTALGVGYVARSRKAAERRTGWLERREADLRATLEEMPLAMIVADREGAILAANRTARGVFAPGNEARLDTIGDLFISADRSALPAPVTLPTLERAAQTGRLITGLCSDGKVREFSVSITRSPIDPEGLATIYLRDETSRCAAERRVLEIQAEMAQIGRTSAIAAMGAAVAHELNQPLTAAASYLALARDGARGRVATDRGDDDPIDQARAQVDRASAIVKGLRGFARAAPPAPRWIAFASLVADARALFEFAVKEHDVELDIVLDPDAGTIWADPIQIQQVLVNLIQNGAEAVAGCSHRRVELTAVPTAGDCLTVEVTDSGLGLDRAAEARLFQPFNTSKPTGLGIGLVISRTIVEAHGGTLAYRRAESGGATFRFELRRRRRRSGGDTR